MSEQNKRAVLVVCLNPTLQQTMVFDRVVVGEVNRSSYHRSDASGKGMNVCRVLTQLGSSAVLLSHLGGQRVDEFLDFAAKDGVPILWDDSKSPIRTCITILQRDGNSTTELVQESQEVAPGTEKKIRELYTKKLESVEVVVFSGTRSPGYSSTMYAEMVKEAKDAGKFVVLDYRGDDLKQSLVMRPDIIKPNLSEFCATFFPSHGPVREQEDNETMKHQVKAEMEKLYETYNIKTIITRGSKDLWAYDGTHWYEKPSRKVNVLNTIGCGDAFTGGFVHAHVTDKTFSEALEIALDAAARNAATLTPGSLYDTGPNNVSR